MALIAALVAALAALVAPAPQDPAAGLTARQKASLVVVSGLPAPPGVGGVLVQRWNTDAPRPRGALVFSDQEGGSVRAFPELPPASPASGYRDRAAAAAAGRATGRALRRAGVHVDLAPVLDGVDGPLGSRLFRSQSFGLAFARGLLAAGAGACAKHFPGLGSTRVSTDDSIHVDGVVRDWELRGFRAAVSAGVPCVMVSNAFYAPFGPYRASISPGAYRLLREQGFRGVAITDSLSIIRHAPTARWTRQAARAGADMLLFTSPLHAARAIDALIPLARAGELDVHVRRVLALRRRYGLPDP